MENTDLGHMLLPIVHVSNNATCIPLCPKIEQFCLMSLFWASDQLVTGFIDATSSELFSSIIMASQLRTKTFAVVGDQRPVGNYSAAAGGETAALFDWWRKIAESPIWQETIFYLLCASYAFMATVALVQLIRIQLRVPEYGWTAQKVFHLMNFVVNALRAVVFGFYRGVFHLRQHALKVLLLDLPGLLFFSTYTLLILFWAEVYYQARSFSIDNLRPTYYKINGVVYIIQICIWIFIKLSGSPAGVDVAKLFFSVISFCAAMGFLIYGGRLFVMLRHFPIESRGRQKKLHEVGFVTGVCSICFLIKCIVVGISAFNEDADIDVLVHPILNLIYYMMVEILPSAMVLFILRKLPAKRVSDQYHPIQ
nr:tobamovirus multiplication protein 1-like [Ipomoea batatas]GME08222.1 tobamovirus multiplication protein 1-like [Ipomoea batatas]